MTITHRNHKTIRGRKTQVRENNVPYEAWQTGGRTMHAEVLQGLPYQPLEDLQVFLQFTVAQVADLLQVPMRTLARRKSKGRLDPVESDRLARVTTIVGEAVDLFEGNGASA